MSNKLLKKLREKEEKLLDCVYEIQELLDSTEDGELASMGADFCEVMVDFIHENDTMSLNEIRTFIEESMES
jgi:hypothetical protein